MGSAADGKARRKNVRGERTRAKLVGAAIDLLRSEGVNALSVTELTRRVGVHSSLFYTHFKNLDECLGMAAQTVLASLGPKALGLLSEVVTHVVTDREELERRCAEALDEWLEQRAFVEILLAHRFDRTPMGDALRAALAGLRSEFMAELWSLMSRLGVPAERVGEASLLADVGLNHWLWALECAIEERIPQRALLAQALADHLEAATRVALSRGTRLRQEQALVQDLTPERLAWLNTRLVEYSALVRGHDDATVLELSGGLEGLVGLVMGLLCKFYLPSMGHSDVAVELRVDHGERCLAYLLWTRDGHCHARPSEPDDQPRATARLGLRAFMEVTSGVRSYGASFRSADVVLQGDTVTLLELLGRFYLPSQA